MGLPGGFEDVLPYFRRSEDNERGESDYDGVGGPLAGSDCRSMHPLVQACIGAEVDARIWRRTITTIRPRRVRSGFSSCSCCFFPGSAPLRAEERGGSSRGWICRSGATSTTTRSSVLVWLTDQPSLRTAVTPENLLLFEREGRGPLTSGFSEQANSSARART
jgi:choline dehydrogenase-like flavoprotein